MESTGEALARRAGKPAWRWKLVRAVVSFLSICLVSGTGDPTADGGGTIAYSSHRPGDDWQGLPIRQIHTVSWNGDSHRELTTAPPGGCRSWCSSIAPVWSPDGSTIAYTSDRDGGYEDNDIYLMAPDGTAARRLTNNTGFHSQLAWSPDSSRLAFVLSEGSEFEDYLHDIFVIDVESGRQVRLTFDQELEGSLAWSPDGETLAYVDRHDVLLLSPDGERVINVTGDGAGASWLSWSPDGSRLAYENVGGIWVIGANGRDRIQLSGAADYRPVWSPDDRWIAFQSKRDGNLEVYIVGLDGEPEVNLSNNPGDDHRPAWSADGSRLAFVSNRDGRTQIYVVELASGGPTNVTRSGSYESQPAWQPVSANK